MRLNLGAGDNRIDGYVSVDIRTNADIDIVCDATDLKFATDGTIEAILAEDVLEHIPAARTQQVLAEWRRVLQPGGTLVVRVPNMHGLAVQLAHYSERAEQGDDRAAAIVRMLIQNIYGGHRWGPDGAYDAHHTGWTPRWIAAELEAAGFAVISNDGALNMRVEAKKP